MTLLGQVGSVNGRENDFRLPRNLGRAIPLLFKATATFISCTERNSKVVRPNLYLSLVWSIPAVGAFSKFPPLRPSCNCIRAPAWTGH